MNLISDLGAELVAVLARCCRRAALYPRLYSADPCDDVYLVVHQTDADPQA